MKDIKKRILGSKSGFTLIELLVVMVILVLLASAVTLIVVKRVEEAKHAKAVTDIESIGNAMDQFYLHCGRYPSSDEGLGALRAKPQNDDLANWSGPYIKREVPHDPWGRAYNFISPGDRNPVDADIINWD